MYVFDLMTQIGTQMAEIVFIVYAIMPSCLCNSFYSEAVLHLVSCSRMEFIKTAT